VDDARAFSDLAPALPTGGFSDAPALSIANDVMQAMLCGGPNGEPFNWKWNRLFSPYATWNDPTGGGVQNFFLNSWQQDYFVPNVVLLGWLESCSAVNYSCTQYPKPVYPVMVKRDLLITFNLSNNNDARICWMQNDTMQSGMWGLPAQVNPTGNFNPGPGMQYFNPVGLSAMQPFAPSTSIHDAFGNLWTVNNLAPINNPSQVLTCGPTNPFLTNLNPVYPTVQNPTAIATTVMDGTVQWIAINPKGQGFRVSPLVAETGPEWLIQPVAQAKVPFFTSLQQYLDPVPDDFYSFFKQGFFAQCYRRNPDQKVRAKFQTEWEIWQKALQNAVRFGANQEDDWGFVPGSNVMDTGYSYNPISPAAPYGPWSYLLSNQEFTGSFGLLALAKKLLFGFSS